ncbi:MAG TPA: hypothetical protein VL528_03755 [Oxalicibacterium sp.]|jgi:hypothetical protein|nr:hypothetical protein [Oxalicibacterium sp.]
MATPHELHLGLQAIQARYAAEQFSAKVREELESLEQSLRESIQEHPEVDYDEIEDDIVDFSIFAFGGCY